MRVRSVLSSREGGTLLKNFFSLSALQVVSYIFPLITLPYLSRTIGVKNFGDVAFATAVVMYFQVLVDWGYNLTATRDVARAKDDKEKVSHIFSVVFWSRLLLTVGSFILLSILVVSFDVFQEIKLLLYFRFILILGYLLYSDWIFQAIEKMGHITILNIISNLFFTCSIFLFINKEEDYPLYPLLLSLGFVVSGMISFFYLLPKYEIRLRLVPFSDIKKSLKSSFDVFTNQAIPIFTDNLVILFLGFWGGNVANGLFDAGNKVVSIMQRLMSVISRVFFPFLARRMDKYGFYLKVNLTIAAMGSLTLFTLAPFFVDLLFAEEFKEAVIVLRILSPSVFFVALLNTFGMNYLVQHGEEKKLRSILFLSVLATIGIGIPMIYFFNWIGAAISITIFKAFLGFGALAKALLIKKSCNQ